MTRSSNAILLAMAAACWAAVGCVSSRPVHYYTLSPGAPLAGQGKPDGPVLLVGNIAVAEPLQDGRIRYRSGTNEAGAYEYHRWAERPSEMVRGSLIRALRSSGNYQRVMEASSSAAGDYLLRGKLDEFDEIDQGSIRTRISLHLEMVERKTNHIVWDRLVEREEPVAAKSIPEVVQSLERNLQQVVREATGEIDKFLAGPR